MRVNDVAKQLGISTSTVRKYSREGLIKHEYNRAGHRTYSQKNVDDFLGKEKDTNSIFYIRSSSGDKTLLKAQEDELTEKYGIPKHIYKDNSSGLNENRSGLQKLLRDANDQKFNTLYVTYEDRLSRFGFSFLKRLLEKDGVEIIVLHDTVKYSAEAELLQDFMNLLASFSGKFYRLRSKESKQKLLDTASKELGHGKE